jgi:hypothetical protein
MARWSAYVKTYGDLELLKGCIASIPSEIEVFVVDGRYADFPGDTLRTPGCEEWCSDKQNVTYCTPDDGLLPWGHEEYEDKPLHRIPIHEQAKWANHERLPQDQWVLHMDADERLEQFDPSVLDVLDDRQKGVPYIDSLAERGMAVPRLYKPKHWTFWIAGVMYPREFWPRDTPVEKLQELHLRSMTHQAINREKVYPYIRIHNRGDERDPEYHESRADQLEMMGRHDRAKEYREMVSERTQ